MSASVCLGYQAPLSPMPITRSRSRSLSDVRPASTVEDLEEDLRKQQKRRRIFDDALRDGIVTVKITNALIQGEAGVGKTCIKRILCNQGSASSRDSTPLADISVHVRDVTDVKVHSHNNKWKEVNDEKLHEIVGAMISGVVREIQAKDPTEIINSADKQPANKTPSTLLPLAQLELLIADLRDKVVDSHHPRSQDARQILGSNWIYFIDSGGQPHFHNLLPHFLHGISIALFTLKLSEQLDSHSMVEYYENGKLISTPYQSPLTTIDTLKCLVRSMQSHTINGEKPTLVIVGTFRDEINKRYETVQEKNERLLKILSPEFTDQLVFCNETEDELIFALNGKDPGPHEERMAKMIRSIVDDSPSKVIEMPIWWYVLEMSLKEMSNRLNRKVLSIQECLEVAKQIHIEENALVEALKFFHEQHIFHYYVDILPNVVFTSSQVLLDKLTELVKEAYDKRIKSTATAGRAKASKGKWQKFRDKGIITLEFVEHFSKHYVEGLFSPPDLLKIFMNLLILTPFSSEIDVTSRTAQYFMPSLLDMLTQDKIMEYHVESVLVSPLLIKFSNGWPRAGVFCCLQVYLIHQLGWKFLLIRGKPKLIAQNCVLLSPPGSSCRVTLIDSFSYIEVHVEGGKDVCSAMCPTIRNQIIDGIHASCQTLRYSAEKPQSAFFCPCILSSPVEAMGIPHFHAAVLLKDGNLRCTFDESITSKVQSEEMIWLQNTASATGYTVGSFSQSVGTVFQRLMDTCQFSTTAQASEPKKEDAVSLSPPPAPTTGLTIAEKYIKEIPTTSVGEGSLRGISVAQGQEHTTEQAVLSHTTKVDALLSSNGLTCKDGNRECRDDPDILNISLQLEQWELVATRLGLTQAEIEAIEYNNRTIEMMRLNCLKKWKSKALLTGTATYRVLLQALLALSCNDQAKQVCSLLKESLESQHKIIKVEN